MQKAIFLDYASTTPVEPAVAEAMMKCLCIDGNFANPASRSHQLGWFAEEAVDIARHQVADLFNADAREIVFTSGATEANNLAIKGSLAANPDKGKHIITVSTEHKAVLDVFEHMKTLGYRVTVLKPQENGLLNFEELRAAIENDTALISVMFVNNETGVIQNIAQIGELCRQHNILFHTDAVQAVGKLAIDLSLLPVDLMSFSAHKVYGPKGVGGLFVRRRPRVLVHAQMHGGAHERGFRSGTLATHQIVGMGKAYEIAAQRIDADNQHCRILRDRLWKGIQVLPGVRANTAFESAVGHILNVSLGTLDSQQFLPALAPIAVSSGSACTSATMTPSHVLTSMGISNEHAHSAIRFSVGRFTTEQDVDFAIQKITEVVLAFTQTDTPVDLLRQ